MKSNSLLSMKVLVKRYIKLYLKDKITVFFSILAPVIVLLLYILFLGDMQVASIKGMLEDFGIVEGTVTTAEIRMLINNWMIAGVMSVSCITVALNANNIMVRDRVTGNINDVLAAPVKRWVVYLSYIISCFIITFCICFLVLIMSIVYLAATQGLMMSFMDFLAIFGITILSIMSSAFFTTMICSFIKTQSALSAINGVVAAAVGFLIGAYLPFSMLPQGVQYLACFIPGTYSAGLYRNYFMRGIVDYLKTKELPPNVMETLLKDYSIDLEFFGTKISAGWMTFALLISIVIFGILLWVFYSNKKTNFFTFGRRKLKKVKKH